VKNGAVSVAFGKKLVIKMMMVEEKEKINIVWCIVYTILFLLLLKIKVEIRTKKSLREREVQRKEYLLKQDT
jgi:DMSO/TMAO reductase YedYZ heme-binding membrane subunit